MIYLDNAATTKPSRGTVEMSNRILERDFYNPSALYYCAVELRKELDASRACIADKLDCKPSEVVFTSGATESNNWAVACGFKNKRGNIVVSESEHPSVYEPVMLLKGKGIDVRTVPLLSDGRVDEERLACCVDCETAFVSVIHASNETGVVNDVMRLSRIVKEKNPRAVFHSDGVQAFCKVPFRLSGSCVDLYSISAHKIGGLKGAGALYIRNGFNISPLVSGGGQERNLRSGTENVMSILSFKSAIEDFDGSHVCDLYDYAVAYLSKLVGVKINGCADHSSGYIVSVGVSGVKSEILQHILSDSGVLVGTGSACSSKTKKNRTLESMKTEKRFMEGNIRISFSPSNTMEEIKRAMDVISVSIEKLRSAING